MAESLRDNPRTRCSTSNKRNPGVQLMTLLDVLQIVQFFGTIMMLPLGAIVTGTIIGEGLGRVIYR